MFSQHELGILSSGEGVTETFGTNRGSMASWDMVPGLRIHLFWSDWQRCYWNSLNSEVGLTEVNRNCQHGSVLSFHHFTMAQCYIFVTLRVHAFVFKVICLTASLEIILNNEIRRFPRAFSNKKGWQVWEEITLLISATADKQYILLSVNSTSYLWKAKKKSEGGIRAKGWSQLLLYCPGKITYFKLLDMVQV